MYGGHQRGKFRRVVISLQPAPFSVSSRLNDIHEHIDDGNYAIVQVVRSVELQHTGRHGNPKLYSCKW